jgi:hypothetical protein
MFCKKSGWNVGIYTLFLTILTSTCLVSSGGCIASSNTSRTAPRYASNVPWANYRRRPIRHTKFYERTLREIKDTNSKYALRLLLCVSVAYRSLRVEELAEILAFDSKGQIPAFRKGCLLKSPVKAVIFTCSTLLSVVEDSQVVQFEHLSVKEFLTPVLFAKKTRLKSQSLLHFYDISSYCHHLSVSGYAIAPNQNINRDSVTRFPLVEYAAEHWFEHAHVSAASRLQSQAHVHHTPWLSH